MRPGLQKLLESIRYQEFDILLVEQSDRLCRDPELFHHIFKRLEYAGIELWTLHGGRVNALEVGIRATMDAQQIADLRHKTRRGLRGVATEGRNAGGRSFGYDTVRALDDKGEPVKGRLTKNENEAAIVNRIFRDYVAGKSPKRIAMELNREGIPGPRSRTWGQSTINGNRRRGTGILNNELYIGRMIWNRQKYEPNPDTGKREARPNPESEWVITEAPELRIVEQALWDQVKAHQKSLEHSKAGFWSAQRPKGLLSGITKCGCCGGGYSKISATHVGCSTARNKGTCHNRMSMKLEKLEEMVIGALRERLMDRELCEEFCAEYTAHLNRLRMERNANIAGYRAEWEKNDRQLEKMVDAIGDGADVSRLKDRMLQLEARNKELERLLETTEEAPVLVHPNMARRYHEAIQDLITSLNDPDHRAESAQVIRKLIDRIVLSPNQDRSALVVDLHGDLAGIMQIAEAKRRRIGEKPLEPTENVRSEIQQVKMVAGVGFEPTTFRL
eukprot:Cvel_2793.t1-p1 / transcript=Cvel_2793.t1 / gene=Cvel_2793 / organism=Chromera_velia_CCMP2878 / gene_product=hypothetical protein / transcript_product=hypothetical protein / location=Cvel_scaffold113:1595-3097(-) / protein_length=501 / sequence_SO=supercontig / SO=protein_coding / is_pseudo=false